MTDTSVAIGKMIVELRAKRKMTQLELATAAGIMPAALSRIENGHVVPRIDTVERLAAALGVKRSRLLDA